MTNVPPRSDSFYRFAVFAGLALALFALAWGRWNLGSARERLFALTEQQIHARAAAEQARGEVNRIAAYADAIDQAIDNETGRTAARSAFLIGEAKQAARRLDRMRIELDRRQAIVEAKTRQAAALQRLMDVDSRLADGLAAMGFVLSVPVLLLWYLRRQLPLDAALRKLRAGSDETLTELPSDWEEAAVFTADREDRGHPFPSGRELPITPS